MSFKVSPFVSLLVFIAVAVTGGCGGNDESSNRSSGNSGTTCTVSNGSNVVYCYAFTASYPTSSMVCDQDAGQVSAKVVSSCPTENLVGKCTVTIVSGNTTTGYQWVFYEASGMSCESAKKNCENMNGSTQGMSSTFEGNGC